jgi:hypothetical protein
MRTSRMRWVAVVAVLAMSLGTAALGAEEESLMEAATETLFISAGCPTDTPGTCTSTRWLGTDVGDASSNFLTSTTPADAALHAAGQEPSWRDYPSNRTLLADGYVLRADEPLVATVAVRANGIGLQNNVDARISARILGEDGVARNVSFTAQRQVVDLLPGDTAQVTFEWDLADHEGDVLQRMTFETRVFGYNAQAGYIDQAGGSTVEIPHLLPTAE